MAIEKAIKNVVAERIVIGILLNHPDWMVELAGVVKADYFFMLGHKTIFHIVKTLVEEGHNTIDSMTILARAEKISKATEIISENGGIEYLEGLKELHENYTIEDLKTYSEEVTVNSYKREQLDLNDSIKEMMYNVTDLTVGQIDIKIQEKQQELLNKYSFSRQIKFIGDVFDIIWQEIEESRQGDGITGLPTKIKILNTYFTYEGGELIVIGARPKYGKSNWAINEIHNLAVVNGIPVAYFDTEMKTKTFMLRIIALDSGVSINEIKTGKYKDDLNKLMAVEASKERVRKAPIIHKYDHAWDKSKIAHQAKLLKLRYGIGMLIYDYIKVKEVSGNVKEHSELGNMTIFLKDLAGELDIPVLTFAQMSPHEKRLADSDKINRYASTIAYLFPKTQEQIKRDFGADEGGTDYIYVDYNRNGKFMSDPEKGINLKYTRYLAKFEEAPYQILQDEYQ